jgi:hypothetical protein
VDRADLPSVWLLVVRELAFDDLDVPASIRGDIEALKGRYPILRCFFDDLVDERRVDDGRPIGAVNQSKVFRIREGDKRAAVWYDAEHGVVWLCRALAIADFPDEGALYRHFGRLEGHPSRQPLASALLIPDENERREAGGEQHLENTIAALMAARDRAYREPRAWHSATMRTPAGSIAGVGRAYVDRQALDASGELVTRFIIVLDEWPACLPRPADWRSRITASCFADDEDVMRAYWGLPVGTGLRPGEVPLVQERLEPRRGS